MFEGNLFYGFLEILFYVISINVVSIYLRAWAGNSLSVESLMVSRTNFVMNFLNI